MCCCNYCKRWSYQIIKLNVNKKSMTHYIWYVLCSEQPSACFMNIMKLNYVLEAKKFNILRSVRCANNFGHHCILCIYIYIYCIYIIYFFSADNNWSNCFNSALFTYSGLASTYIWSRSVSVCMDYDSEKLQAWSEMLSQTIYRPRPVIVCT